MRHVLSFIAVIFLALFFAQQIKKNSTTSNPSKSTLKIFANSSFISQWGAGPALKENFEKYCECVIEFFDGNDNQFLLRRLKNEGEGTGADLVLGLDQFDLDSANQLIKWNKIETANVSWDEKIKMAPLKGNLIPYDWSPMTFLVRKTDFLTLPKKLKDLLDPNLKGKIALPDPRTSSVGLQFLIYVLTVMGEEKGFNYFEDLNPNVLSYTPSWSYAYGLFQKGQALTTFSYVTSSIYHLVEEKTKEYIALNLQEGHPAQFEYLGIPIFCKNCQLAEKFVDFVLSPSGQKILMEKNYMLPVIKNVVADTPFANLPNYNLIDMESLPTIEDKERILKKWSDKRRQN